MKKFFTLLLALVVWSSAASAQLALSGFGSASNGLPVVPPAGMKTPLLLDNAATGPSTIATQYINVSGGGSVWSGSAAGRDQPIALSAGGSVKGLTVRFPVVLAQGSYTISLAVNGIVSAGSLTCQITTSVSTCTDTTHEVIFNYGDRLSWQSVPSATAPTAQTQVQIGAYITSYGTDTFINVPSSSNPLNSTTQYTTLGIYASFTEWQTTEAAVAGIIPAAGTIDSIWVQQQAVSGGTNFAYSIFLNGAQQVGSICTVGAAAINCNVIGLGIAVVPGDLVSIQQVPTGTPTASALPRISVGFTPTIANRAVQIVTAGGVSGNGTRYLAYEGISGGSTEANSISIIACATTIKLMRVAVTASLSAAMTRVHTLRKGTGGGQSDQALTCTMNNVNTTGCTDSSNTVTTADNDLINWSSVANATAPTTTTYKYSSVMEGCTP